MVTGMLPKCLRMEETANSEGSSLAVARGSFEHAEVANVHDLFQTIRQTYFLFLLCLVWKTDHGCFLVLNLGALQRLLRLG